MGIGLLLFAIINLTVLLEAYRRIEREHQGIEKTNTKIKENTFQQLDNNFRQIEALLSLFLTLRPSAPLSDTRGWAASPDLLKKITEIIYQKRPALIVEASSGISTLICAYSLKNVGKGKIISLEHDPKYTSISRKLVSMHGMEDVATILYAPLKEFEINSKKWLWYDINGLNIDRPIDLLLVDGPPGDTQRLARYPAIPLLIDKISDDGMILLDDGYRQDESKIVELWASEFRLSYEFLPLEKGAYLIKTSPR